MLPLLLPSPPPPTVRPELLDEGKEKSDIDDPSRRIHIPSDSTGVLQTLDPDKSQNRRQRVFIWGRSNLCLILTQCHLNLQSSGNKERAVAHQKITRAFRSIV